jgi:hypothetical protein
MSLKLLKKLIGEIWVYNVDFFLLCRCATVMIFNISGKMPDSMKHYIYVRDFVINFIHLFTTKSGTSLIFAESFPLRF